MTSRDRRLFAGLALLGLAALACGGRQSAPAPGSAAADRDEEPAFAGRVTVVGHTPFVHVLVLPDDGGTGVEVVGSLRDELAAASGAEVEVRGPIIAPGPMLPHPQMEVRSYEIRSVAGMKPLVGTLEARDGAYYLRFEEEERTLALAAVPPELREKVGAKVWVALSEDRVVTAYGILREP